MTTTISDSKPRFMFQFEDALRFLIAAHRTRDAIEQLPGRERLAKEMNYAVVEAQSCISELLIDATRVDLENLLLSIAYRR